MFGNHVTDTAGNTLEILYPGAHNNDAGPDFSAAVLRDGDTRLAGNVEIHVKASDWARHGHNEDPAYDTVILHVVGVDDAKVARTDGSEIRQTCVTPPAEFYDRYVILTEKMDSPTCLPWLGIIPALNRRDWMESLGMERLHEKARYLKQLLAENKGDWQQAIFIAFARALGFGLNGVPFELLAKSLPLNFIMRHRDNPVQVEALLFGQAGMLDPQDYPYDEYYQLLCREYGFLSKKYALTPLQPEIWKYSRSRPQNFPHRRIAILATMLTGGMQFYSAILEAKGDIDILKEILDFRASDYWQLHSRFGAPQAETPLPVTLSNSSKEIVIINVMAPFYYAYGSATGEIDLAEKGYDLLQGLNAERNSIVQLWGANGLPARSAFDSQAQIQLRKCYCDKSRCLECRFGHYLLRDSMRQQHILQA
ncbi:MAG: DUF2851 family protein [Muribaculaceae bacterium]|nr:DUF2851 family protein [Muribaculaceae bacterium]